MWRFDSFQGLPPPTEDNHPVDRGDRLHRLPQMAVSIEEVIEDFRRIGLWTEQVRLLKGWFKDTVPAADVGKIAALRLDGDLMNQRFRCWTGSSRSSRPAGFAVLMTTGRCSVAGLRSKISGGTAE